MDQFNIGDFSRPVVPAGAPPAGQTQTALEREERNLKEQADSVEKALDPMLAYQTRLREAGIAPEKAAAIIDSVLQRGFHSEVIPIRKEGFEARFRTRTTRDLHRAQVFLEATRPSYEVHYQDILTRYLLAASLEQMGADKFEHPSRDATPDVIERLFTLRLSYVNTMAEPAYRLLSRKLAEFDRRIALVLEEGAIENF